MKFLITYLLLTFVYSSIYSQGLLNTDTFWINSKRMENWNSLVKISLALDKTTPYEVEGTKNQIKQRSVDVDDETGKVEIIKIFSRAVKVGDYWYKDTDILYKATFYPYDVKLSILEERQEIHIYIKCKENSESQNYCIYDNGWRGKGEFKTYDFMDFYIKDRAICISVFNEMKLILENLNSNVVQMVKRSSNTYEVPVELNGVLKISFIFDSGASDISISKDVAMTLIKNGTIKQSDYVGTQKYQFANGDTATRKVFMLHEIKIGNKVLANVKATINESLDAPMLLGQSVLQRFGKFTIDNSCHTLTIIDN